MADQRSRSAAVFAAGDWLATVSERARFVFRGDASARAAAGAAFDLPLPEQACRATANGERAALWLGPDECLLLAPAAEGDGVRLALARALQWVPHSLVDVSQRQVGLEVHGPRCEWLLESQCPLPLNLRDFPVGMCTRTVYAKAEIVLWRRAELRFQIEVWRSFGRYVTGLLREVAAETER